MLFSRCPPVHDVDVLSLNPAEIAQALKKGLISDQWAGVVVQVANPRHLPRLLRLGGKAKRKEHSAKKAKRREHSAKRHRNDFFVHRVSPPCLSLLTACCSLLTIT